jgi:hypothetical protein
MVYQRCHSIVNKQRRSHLQRTHVAYPSFHPAPIPLFRLVIMVARHLKTATPPANPGGAGSTIDVPGIDHPHATRRGVVCLASRLLLRLCLVA